MVVGTQPDLRVGRAVAQHDVELVEGQLRHQPVGGTVDAGHPHVLLEMKGGAEQTMDKELGKGVSHAHDEADRPAGRPAADDILELPTERKDLVGISVDGLSRFGEGHCPSPPLEQRCLHRFFQRLQLGTDGRLREMENLAGLCDAPLPGDRPEIEEVVVVQPAHGGPP